MSFFLNLNDRGVFESFGGNAYWEKVEIPGGIVFLKEGETSMDFYFISKGLVQVTKAEHVGGAEKELARLGEGDFFGEGALLSDRGRGASVKTLEDSVFYKLTPIKLSEMMEKKSVAAMEFILGIVRGLNDRLDLMNRRLIALYEVPCIHEQKEMNKGDLKMMMQGFFMELGGTLHHKTALFFGTDGLPLYQCSDVKQDDVFRLQSRIPDLAIRFQGDSNLHFVEIEGDFYAVAKDGKGKFMGVLAAQLCGKCQNDDTKLLLTIAEQIGRV
ncbi:MAG: cyclic nucleotide-binding domain-containing protein [Patescibacteria group bacterium]